ncbi:MAG: IgGFc-binding protein [Tannerellaceae bacterium]|nr:IgGFc-binding protein [Tannerellaceae bacterium]
MKSKLLCLFLICCTATAHAQDTDFWFVVPHTADYMYAGNYFDLPAFFAISNNTYQTAHIKITRYNGGGANIIEEEHDIPAGNLFTLDFTTTAQIKTVENPRANAGNVTHFGTHIESNVPVTVYYMANHTDTRDIFTLKGRQALGKDFYVPMQHDNLAQTGGYTGAFDQIDIVATKDGTLVEVTPKATIWIGTSSTANANVKRTYTLNKGQTLKIMERYINSGSLAGTIIHASDSIAVTVMEDLVGGDTSGDQIVPLPSLGTRYIIPKTFMSNSGIHVERVYLVGSQAGTTVSVYASGTTPTATITLTAGETKRYDIPSTSNAVYIESNHPVYVYQRGGYGEEGAALLPSVYSIGQTSLSFYHVFVTGTPKVQVGFLIFRTGKESSFTIKYGSLATTSLSLTPLDIPNVPEWKIARFNLNVAPSGGEVVKIQNEQSPFSFGYITGNDVNNDSYGFFSAFGDFRFAGGDTTFMCGSSVILQGGYAMSYKWFFGGELVGTGTSYTATQEGLYTLEMNQDPNIVTASTFVRKVNAGSIAPSGQLLCSPTATPTQLSVTGAVTPSNTQYQWQSSTTGIESSWNNIAGATSATYQPPQLPAGTTTLYYRRGMSSIYCELAYTPAVAITTVAGAVTPAAQIQCESDASPFAPLTVTTTANFPNVSYQWQKSADGGAIWSHIPGAGAVTYQPPILPLPQTYPGLATLTTAYRCLVTSNACTVPTNVVSVAISPCVLPVNPPLRSRAVQ